ncbi:hypothetical protein OAK82_02215 [Candidatus Thioglobus sp.]|nr:hypothetical protein [Candidatus Thioglobus sp.]
MDSSQYKLLCKACDEAINKDKNFYRVSIPKLHVMKEHPVLLKQYQTLFENVFGNASVQLKKSSEKSGLFQKILNILSFNSSQKLDLPYCKNFDTIIISHLVNADHLNNNDFYFYDIPSYLNHKINPLVVLINHTNKDSEVLSKKLDNSKVFKVILPKKLNFSGEAKIILGLIKELILIRISSYREKGLLRQVLKFSSKPSGFSGALFALRLGKQVNTILNSFKPKAVITTYEGHSWERVIYGVVYQYDPDLLRIGYQHSVITKMAHSIARPLGKKYDPDLILCSGTITHALLQKALEKSHTELLVLGSSKSLSQLKVKNRKKDKICLVIPEGVVEECDMLFNFSIMCANVLPDINFIWRLHPVISFEKVLAYMSIKAEDLPNNIIISNLSLSEDISRSSFALYRGTTAIIEAIYGNLIPIYLSDDSDLTIDFLHSVGKDRKIVSSVKEFKGVIEDDTPWDSNNIINYCENYFMAFDYSIFQKIINR